MTIDSVMQGHCFLNLNMMNASFEHDYDHFLGSVHELADHNQVVESDFGML